jgi:hypothetical protein
MFDNNVISNVEIQLLELENQYNGKKLDLTNIFISLSLYEDIFTHFSTAKLIIEDSFDLQQTVPLIGGEKIRVLFLSQNDNEPKRRTFEIYKIEKDSKETVDSKNAKIYILYLASKEYLIDGGRSISKRFYDKPSAILKYILKTALESNKRFEFSYEDDKKIDFWANFWTPSQTIRYMNTITKRRDIADYLLFENKKGFHYMSLYDLLNESPTHKLMFVDELTSKYNRDQITKFILNKYFNIIELNEIGAFGNTVFKYEDYTYAYSKFQHDFKSITEFNPSLGKKVQFYDYFKNNNDIITTHKDNDLVSKRNVILKALDKYHMIIQLPGDSTKTIGQVYEIDLKQKIRDKSTHNELLTGNWFVTNVRHEILKSGEYTQNIKVVKNAFFHYNNTDNVIGPRNI